MVTAVSVFKGLVRPITDQEQTAGQRQQGNDIIAEEYFGVPKLGMLVYIQVISELLL